MKKTLLLIASLLFLAFGYTHAQSLKLIDKDGNDITGQTVDKLCVDAEGLGSFKLDVQNTATVAKTVKVRKVEMSMLNGIYGLTMCWVECYAPFVFETPESLVIDAGAISTNFEGDITYPETLKGSSTAKFVFFDVDNPSDTSFVIVNYHIGPLSIAENLMKSLKVSNAYPNPASSMVNFDYKLPQNANNAKINISNLLGTTVSTIELIKTEGKASLNVNNLKDGVYFYTLVVNNAATVTRKFVVKR